MDPGKLPAGINSGVKDSLYNGDLDMYVFAIESFTSNAPNSIAVLRHVTAENLEDYKNNVHALKSMAGAIGAESIGAAAAKLEMLSKSGDLSGILAENSVFLSRTENLVTELKNWLKANG